jgi:hypothetical protein
LVDRGLKGDDPAAAPWPWKAWGRAVAALVFFAALRFGGRALSVGLISSFRNEPASFFSPPFRRQLEIVTGVVPPGVALLHIFHEFYLPRCWQRALYPRNPLEPVQPPDFGPKSLRRIRERIGARYAISAGSPPMDPGFRWHRVLDPIPGTGETWFGELAP